MRALILAAIIVASLSWTAAPSAEAQRISRGNPYRALNIHGRNYGSVRWERERRSGYRSHGYVPSYRSGYRGLSSRSYRVPTYRGSLFNAGSSSLYRRR